MIINYKEKNSFNSCKKKMPSDRRFNIPFCIAFTLFFFAYFVGLQQQPPWILKKKKERILPESNSKGKKSKAVIRCFSVHPSNVQCLEGSDSYIVVLCGQQASSNERQLLWLSAVTSTSTSWAPYYENIVVVVVVHCRFLMLTGFLSSQCVTATNVACCFSCFCCYSCCYFMHIKNICSFMARNIYFVLKNFRLCRIFSATC